MQGDPPEIWPILIMRYIHCIVVVLKQILEVKHTMTVEMAVELIVGFHIHQSAKPVMNQWWIMQGGVRALYKC